MLAKLRESSIDRELVGGTKSLCIFIFKSDGFLANRIRGSMFENIRRKSPNCDLLDLFFFTINLA